MSELESSKSEMTPLEGCVNMQWVNLTRLNVRESTHGHTFVITPRVVKVSHSFHSDAVFVTASGCYGSRGGVTLELRKRERDNDAKYK